jgi:DNA modification methylase
VRPWITLTKRELVEERIDAGAGDVHFPERLAERVISEFSAAGDLVLDPFAGFGTTAVVAERLGRRAIAVELVSERADIIRRRLEGRNVVVITGDARKLTDLMREPIDLCFTSPPYMTRTRHPENPMTGYATLDGDYNRYLDEMESVGRSIAVLLRPGGYLVLNAATTIGIDGATPLADDLADRLSRYLSRLPDLPIAWDEPPAGIVDDRCLVFKVLTPFS